jgi:hypothetical protein
MKAVRILGAALAAMMWASVVCAAGEKEQDGGIRVAVEVRDGSRIHGASLQESLPVRCSFGEITVPLALIAKVTMLEDREQATITFANGDRLTGVPGWREVKLTAIVGALAIPLNEVREWSTLVKPVEPK